MFNCSVIPNSLWPYGLQHARLPCPSLSLGACSNSCPLSQWCHPTISSSVIPFSSCLQSFPASGSFPMSQIFTSGDQSIRASSSVSVLPMNIQDWSPLGLTGWISLQYKGLSRVFSNTTVLFSKYDKITSLHSLQILFIILWVLISLFLYLNLWSGFFAVCRGKYNWKYILFHILASCLRDNYYIKLNLSLLKFYKLFYTDIGSPISFHHLFYSLP